jgi:hypothetical protein
MKIARYWRRQTATAVDARGKEHRADACGWSETDPEEAVARAKAAAQRVAEFLAAGGVPRQRHKGYLYSGERPPREEILKEFHDTAGETSAYVSRNSYGALVLNARDLMFIDVDFQSPPGKLQQFVSRLFNRRMGAVSGGPEAPDASNSEEAIAHRIQHWCADHLETASRVYRTAAGFRVMIVNQLLRAGSEQARQNLLELGSDPMYSQLCESQQCFRARLTPKPWRIHQSTPPARYPFSDEKAERKFRKWQEYYERACLKFATCRFISSNTRDSPLPELAPLVELHDSLTHAHDNLPLA